MNLGINANELDKESLLQVATTFEQVDKLNVEFSGKDINEFFSRFGKSEKFNKNKDGVSYFYGAKKVITVTVETNSQGIIQSVKTTK